MDYLPKLTNDKLAKKLIQRSLGITKRLLVLIGKPLYFLFSYTFLAVVFFVYITGLAYRKINSLIKRRGFSQFLQQHKTKLEAEIKKAWKAKLVKLAVPTLQSVPQKIKSIPETIEGYYKNIRSKKTKKVVFKSSYLWLEPYKNKARKIKKTFRKIYLSLSKQLKGKQKEIRPILRDLYQKLTESSTQTTSSILKSIRVFKEKIKLLLLKLRIKITTTLSLVIGGFKKLFLSKKTVYYFLATTSLIALTASYLFWDNILKDLPSPDKLTDRRVEVSTKIYDRNGKLLYNIYKDENRTPISLEDVPVHVRLATIAVEDAEFYDHPGFSIKGITRAIIKNLREGELTGGSTITQQLVKNALLTPEKTIERKLKEITLAVQTELTYSKDKILEMYLNEVSYGGTAYGVQEAARTYFDKNVDQLTLGEAALLAGLPKSPSTYSPFGSEPEKGTARQKEVLRLMQENGFITQEQREKAENEKLTFAENKTDIKAPHFVMYVRDQLEEEYGASLVEQGGLKVVTTLDLDIQRLAEEIVRQEVENLKDLNVGNGAAVILDPETGDILAMVGSKDYFNTAEEGNVNVATSLRQPGSSIKIVNYAYALSNGHTPATIIEDTRTTFLVPDQPEYTPRNYDGRFRGNLTLRSAFAESRNITAVKVLASYGVDKMLNMGEKMGITTWDDPSQYGLSLTLGGGDVKLVDLAQAYATVANYGQRPELKSVIKISNQQGEVLEDNGCEENKLLEIASRINQEVAATESAASSQQGEPEGCGGEQVLDPRVAFILTDILKDNRARTPAFGSNSLLIIPEHPEVAVKTGTSNDLRDNLTVGYTKDYVVAVWVGNNDNSQMARVASGVTGATPIFNKIMTALLAEQNSEVDATLTSSQESNQNIWEVPEGLVQLPICASTGTLTCTGCPQTRMEWFLEENRPDRACSPEWFVEEEDEEKDDKSEEDEVENQNATDNIEL